MSRGKRLAHWLARRKKDIRKKYKPPPDVRDCGVEADRCKDRVETDWNPSNDATNLHGNCSKHHTRRKAKRIGTCNQSLMKIATQIKYLYTYI